MTSQKSFSCSACDFLEFWSTEISAVPQYRYTIVTSSFMKLYSPTGNHKLKFQKKSLIFHFRMPGGAEYRARRQNFRFSRIISEYRYLRSFSFATLEIDAAKECRYFNLRIIARDLRITYIFAFLRNISLNIDCCCLKDCDIMNAHIT